MKKRKLGQIGLAVVLSVLMVCNVTGFIAADEEEPAVISAENAAEPLQHSREKPQQSRPCGQKKMQRVRRKKRLLPGEPM